MKTSSILVSASSLIIVALLAAPAIGHSFPSEQDPKAIWTNWRGPTFSGAAPAGAPPTTWSEDKNIRWKIAVPGRGSSSPIIWGNHIFVTTAIKTDRDGPKAKKPAEGETRPDRGRRGGRRGRRRMRRPAPTKIHEFMVLCIDRRDGKVAWKTKVKEAVPHEGGHRTATQASGSCVTDGKHIYANFGSRGIFCLDMKGTVVWEKKLGKMRTRNQFGEGSSAALYGNTLVIPWDHEGDSFVVALDKRNGKEIWRQSRDEVTTWSTPLVVEVGGKPQAILTGTGKSRAYDLATGKVVWSIGGMTTNCIPSPMVLNGVAYLMSGFRGAKLQAIKLAGAKGDLSKEGNKSVAWQHDRYTSYVPSATLYKGKLYFLRSSSGRLSCLDAKTGEIHYEQEKLQGIRSVYSSLVGVNDHIYVTSRSGRTVVVKAGPEFKVVATNHLGGEDADGFDASAAIAGNAMYLRSATHLYCIAGQ